MSELHFPWLEAAIFTPFVGALVVARFRDPFLARRWAIGFSALAFLFTFGAWQDFGFLHANQADDNWNVTKLVLGGRELFVIDQLSAPLLPLSALLYFLTMLTTVRTKVRRFSFAWNLLSEANLLAMYSSPESWMLITFMALGTFLPYWELRARRKPTRVFAIHMGLYVVLMIFGWSFVEGEGRQTIHSLWAILPLLLAVFIRSGTFPLHCWIPDLFEHTTFGSALLFTTPIIGAYGAARLVLPIAPEWVLRSIGLLSLVTAVYASGMALVQRDMRRMFCYLFISHSALVLVGMELVDPLSLTGALCVWLSVGLSLGGFGLTLRAIEARCGNLSLTEFHGLYEQTPALAICFFLTGLGCVGFPGTLGFIGTELLVDGAVKSHPFIGIAVVVAAALNGIAFVRTYFALFTGVRQKSMVSLAIGRNERIAVLTLAGLIVVGGLIPQYGVASRERAAKVLLDQRPVELQDPSHADRSEHADAADSFFAPADG